MKKSAKKVDNLAVNGEVPAAPVPRTYGAFLFVPGREWLLFDTHPSVTEAQAHLAEHMAKLPTWERAMVVEIKASAVRQMAAAWQ